MEISSASDLSGGAVPDVLLLAQLDSPKNATIPDFYTYVDNVRTKVSSNNDEELTFKSAFP